MQEYYVEKFEKLRDSIKEYFGPDTCAGGPEEFDENCPSKGQCVPTAAYVNDMFGGQFVSTKVDGISHWYSRVYLYEQWWFVDLTGDQFGYPEVQISKEPLYENTIKREDSELTEEVLQRISLFKEKVDGGMKEETNVDDILYFARKLEKAAKGTRAEWISKRLSLMLEAHFKYEEVKNG